MINILLSIAGTIIMIQLTIIGVFAGKALDKIDKVAEAQTAHVILHGRRDVEQDILLKSSKDIKAMIKQICKNQQQYWNTHGCP